MKKVSGNMKKMNERNEKETIRRNMLMHTSYIDWLIDFTNKYPIFSEEDWRYNSDEISKSDLEKVLALPLLYDCIDEFAKRNYYSPNIVEKEESYLIRKDDTYMNIGHYRGIEDSFYCERVPKQNGSINYYSIINENLPMRTMYVDQKLQNISDDLKELMIRLKVPVEFIQQMVQNASQEMEIEKKLIKK